MNPHSDCTPTKKQTKALYQARRHADPVVRSLEQSSDTVRQRNACTNQAVQEHKSEQQAAARELRCAFRLYSGSCRASFSGIPDIPRNFRVPAEHTSKLNHSRARLVCSGIPDPEFRICDTHYIRILYIIRVILKVIV